jgi:hypothetical protein
MVAVASNDCCAGFFGEVLENVTQRSNQSVVQSVAFGGARQSHNSYAALHL